MAAPSAGVPPFDVVVAVDRNWGIGKANGLPWPKLRADLAHFRAVTSAAPDGKSNAIIMGRKTWQSTEVNGKPLPRRINCVITRSELAVPPGVRIARSLDAALLACADAASIFVVGGAEIYRIALGHAALRYVYLTKVDGEFACDTTIPDLADFVPTGWQGDASHVEHGIGFEIVRLARQA